MGDDEKPAMFCGYPVVIVPGNPGGLPTQGVRFGTLDDLVRLPPMTDDAAKAVGDLGNQAEAEVL